MCGRAGPVAPPHTRSVDHGQRGGSAVRSCARSCDVPLTMKLSGGRPGHRDARCWRGLLARAGDAGLAGHGRFDRGVEDPRGEDFWARQRATACVGFAAGRGLVEFRFRHCVDECSRPTAWSTAPADSASGCRPGAWFSVRMSPPGAFVPEAEGRTGELIIVACRAGRGRTSGSGPWPANGSPARPGRPRGNDW